MPNIVEMRGIDKLFGSSKALNQVNLDVLAGECLGLVGHNGAGKSTLMNILTGIFPPTAGTLSVDGVPVGDAYEVQTANRLGIRAVFQELSLCLNLSVVENMRVFHPDLKGIGWRKRAEKRIMSTLDEIFPGHGIRPYDKVENITLGQRQILEISKAFAAGATPLRLLILDEPTSALDYHTAKQLLDHIKRIKNDSVSCIYISHLLDEVVSCTDRVVVMKDGRIAGELKGAETKRERLIELMGGAKAEAEAAAAVSERRKAGVQCIDAPFLIAPKKAGDGIRIRLCEGEVAGLAGLAGHGQTDLLTDLFDYKKNADYQIRGPVTFIPGDRQKDGNFPLWSIMNNLTVQIYPSIRKYRLIDGVKERDISGRWRADIGIKADSIHANILSLSGGNQQKVLFARCLESAAPVVLMDDPTRGVDIGTKEIIYRLIREQSAKGRGFVWYTTEMEELKHCDRVYVFKSGQILAEMPGDEANEDAVLRASF